MAIVNYSSTITATTTTSSPTLTFNSSGAGSLTLNKEVLKWYTYENDMLPEYVTFDNTSAKTITYNNVGASPVGGSLNLTVVGDLVKPATFVTTNTNILGTTANNNVDLSELRGYAGSNTIRNTNFTVRKSAGSDWTTIALHDSIGVDNLYLTPGTDTKCFWERNLYNETHTFGSSGKTYLTLSSSGAVINGSTVINGYTVVNGSFASGVIITNITSTYTVVVGDIGKIISCTGGSFTVNLPTVTTAGNGFKITISNNHINNPPFSSYFITVAANGTELIDDVTSITLSPNESVELICNGTNWNCLGRKNPMMIAVNSSVQNTGYLTQPSATGKDSIAINNFSTASGGSSIALAGSTASGQRSFSFGASSNTFPSQGVGYSASGSRTIGFNGDSSSDYSSAIGLNSTGAGAVTTSGAGAMALGGSYASGIDSFAAAIGNNTSTYGATGTNSIAIGNFAKATSTYSLAIGWGANAGYHAVAISAGGTFASPTASGTSSVAIGDWVTATGQYSFALNHASVATQYGKYAYASGYLAGQGDAQFGKLVIRAATTTTTAVVLTSDGGAASTTNQLVVASGQAMTFTGMLIGKQTASANIASYTFKGAIVNNAGTVTISTIAVETIIDTIVLDVQPTYTVDSTNKALAITSGYKAATSIRWVCNIESVEVTHA